MIKKNQKIKNADRLWAAFSPTLLGGYLQTALHVSKKQQATFHLTKFIPVKEAFKKVVQQAHDNR